MSMPKTVRSADMYEYNKSLKSNAQALRRDMTPEERHLWYDFLKKLPISVKRQMVIENYILDFYIPKARLAIEVDGRQHLAVEHAEKDAERDSDLKSMGITVIRCRNEDIKNNFKRTCDLILAALDIKASDMI